MEFRMVLVLVAVIVCMLGRQATSQRCGQQELMMCVQPVFMNSGPTSEVADCGEVDEAKTCIEAMYESCGPGPKITAASLIAQLIQIGGTRCLGDNAGLAFTDCVNVMECGVALNGAAQDIFLGGSENLKEACRKFVRSLACLKRGATECEAQRDMLNQFIQTSYGFENGCSAVLSECSIMDVQSCVMPVQHLMSGGEPTEETIRQNCGSLTTAMDCVFSKVEGCEDPQAKAQLQTQLQQIMSFKSELETHCDAQQESAVLAEEQR